MILKSKKSYPHLIIVLILSFQSLYLISCSKQSEEKNVRILTNSEIVAAPLYLAIEKNMIRDEMGNKINLQLEIIEDVLLRKFGINSGLADGYICPISNYFIDDSDKLNNKIVMCLDESYGKDGIVAKSSIKTIKDLKGKTIAVESGTSRYFLLLYLLKKNGLSAADLKIINMNPDRAGAAFVSGKLDAAVTWEPWLSETDEMTNGHKLITTKELPGLITDVLVFRESLLKNTKIINAIINAWFNALDYWEMHKNESDSILAKSYNLTVPIFNDMRSGTRFYDLKLNKDYFGKNDVKGKIYSVTKKVIETWKEVGLIKRTAKFENSIDPSFIRELNSLLSGKNPGLKNN